MLNVKCDSSIGTGHFFRTLQVARQLNERFPIIFCLDPNSYLEGILELEHIAYSTEADIVSVGKRENISLFFFDGLSNDEGLFERLKGNIPDVKIVAMGYFNYDNPYVDVIINLINHHPHLIRPTANHIVYCESLDYAIVRHEFEHLLRKERTIHSQVREILVTFGGKDASGSTATTLSLLKHLKTERLKLDIILGTFFDSRKAIENIITNMSCDAYIHESVPNIEDYMFPADLAFCGAGVTLIELLSIGTPTIVIPQNKRERRFAEKLEKEGSIVLINNPSISENAMNLIEEVFKSHQKRNEMSKAGKMLFDGKGAERACRVIEQALEMPVI